MKTFNHIFITFLIIFINNATYAIDAIPEDITAWTEKGAVLQRGAAGQWDEQSNLPAGISYKNGTYYLYYIAGFNGCWNADSDNNHQSLGVATSSDGINFTKSGNNPLLKPHDFVNVSSHEEGIRLATIRYIPALSKFMGYFGVESPDGVQTCDFNAAAGDGCACDVNVDSYVFAATSDDGIAWTVQGEVAGVGNSVGHENYPDDFQYVNGKYYLWTHKAQPTYIFSAASGSNYLSLTGLGTIPELCWGWNNIHTFLHDDDNTVTAMYDPVGFNPCPPTDNGNYFFSLTALDNMTSVTSPRIVHSNTELRNVILKDVVAGEWKWYYLPTDQLTIQLRTHPLTGLIKPMPPNPLIIK